MSTKNGRQGVPMTTETGSGNDRVPRALSRLKERVIQALPAPKEIALPTYEKDRVGDVTQWDERDIVFARKDFFRYFGTDSPEYKAYYVARPEHLAYDTKVGHMPGLGRTGGVDVPMFEAQFAAIKKIGVESFVDQPVREPLARQHASGTDEDRLTALVAMHDLADNGIPLLSLGHCNVVALHPSPAGPVRWDRHHGHAIDSP